MSCKPAATHASGALRALASAVNTAAVIAHSPSCRAVSGDPGRTTWRPAKSSRTARTIPGAPAAEQRRGAAQARGAPRHCETAAPAPVLDHDGAHHHADDGADQRCDEKG